MSLKRGAFEIAALTAAAALIGFLLWKLFDARDMTLPNGQPLFGDYIAFWTAGRATLDGHVAQIHDRHFLYGYQQMIAPDVRYVALWNSPPTFLLIACVLALAPYPVSAIGFFLATLALFVWAMRQVLPDARALIFPLTAPAVLYQAGTVQVGLLITGVTGFALHWLDRRPRLAGALVALLAVKPHLAVLWPLFLALSGRWRAFWSAAAATAVFVVTAGLVFGFDAYGRFFENLIASQRLISEQQITTPAYASLYANLLDLGAPLAVATAAQAVSAAAAALAACRLFMRAENAVAGAALCAATLLISPYLFFYDFTLLLLGAALLGPPRDRFELAAAVLAWSAGISVALGYIAPLPLCPLAAWAVLAAALRRAGSAALRPAPAQRT